MSEGEIRAELYRAFQSLGEIAPESRLRQLMAAVGERCADLHRRGLWDANDAERLEAVWHFRRDCETATANNCADSSGASVPHGNRSVNEVP